jgi:hypothetical protein
VPYFTALIRPDGAIRKSAGSPRAATIGEQVMTNAGLITELFAELDQMQDEELGYFEPRPQKPKVWPEGPGAANLWGPMPPEEMMK